MYNFDILVKSVSDVDDSLESMDVAFSIEDIPEISIESEIVTATLCGKFFDDLTKSVGVINNVKKHLIEKGCTEALVQLMNPQLLEHGIILEVGRKDDAMYSIEALSDKVNVKNIKETLMKILDVIVNIVQKFTDQNRSDTNELKELISDGLSDTSKVDTRKFASIIASVYDYKSYMDLVNEIGKIDLINEVSGKSTISEGLSKTLKEAFKTAGYRVTDSSIERDPEFTMKKETMENLGWEPAKLRTAAEAALAMLVKVRRSHRTAIKELKGMISKDLTPEKAEEARNRLSYAVKTIAVVERISLVLSRQIIMLAKVLKPKSSTSTEGISVDVSTEAATVIDNSKLDKSELAYVKAWGKFLKESKTKVGMYEQLYIGVDANGKNYSLQRFKDDEDADNFKHPKTDYLLWAWTEQDDSDIIHCDVSQKNKDGSYTKIAVLSTDQNKKTTKVIDLKKVESSTESMDADTSDQDKKPCKKKKHVADCPCMDKDATSCECDCPFESEDSTEVGESTDEPSTEAFWKERAIAEIKDRPRVLISDKRGIEGIIELWTGNPWSIDTFTIVKSVLDKFQQYRKYWIDNMGDDYYAELDEYYGKSGVTKKKAASMLVSSVGIDLSGDIEIAFDRMDGEHTSKVYINPKSLKPTSAGY